MSFKEAVQKKQFVISAELPLTPDSSDESIMADADQLRHCVDGFLLTDNQYGHTHVAPSAAAYILFRSGLSPVLQLNCRTRNRVALMSELLGARAAGVDSLFLVRGTVVPAEYQPRPAAVMDIGCRELIATAKRINDDEKLGSSRGFLIGTSATVHDPNPGWRAEELTAKADAGATVVFTQLCLDVCLLRRYLASLIAQQLLRRLSVIVSIAVIPTAAIMDWLRQRWRDSIVPNGIWEELARPGDPYEKAIDIYAGILREIAALPGVSGVNFMSAGNIELIPEVIARAGVHDHEPDDRGVRG